MLFGFKLSTNSRRHDADKSFIFGIFIEARARGQRETEEFNGLSIKGGGQNKKKANLHLITGSV